MGHVPSAPIAQQTILTLEECLAQEKTAALSYDRSRWLYLPPQYCDYRYLLGTRGKKPVICIGINPSTAAPGALDNTLKSVERVALYNGFDSFFMFNVSAQRATAPGDMDRAEDVRLHTENMKTFAYVLSACPEPVVWAAWGTIIEKRTYLYSYLREMIEIAARHGAVWVSAGKRSAAGHPHHPLYLKKDAAFDPFDPADYLQSLAGQRIGA